MGNYVIGGQKVFILVITLSKFVKRKVNRVGTNTLTISLPSSWVQQQNIKVGDELEIAEEKGQIIISQSALPKKIKKISFEINHLRGQVVRKFLRASYKNGFDEIEFFFKEPECLEEINREVNYLLGFEVISQRAGYSLVKNVASPHPETFSDLVNKVFLVLISFAEEILKILKNKENKALFNLQQQERIQDKLTLACFRLLVEHGEKIVNEPCFIYSLLSVLGVIGDNLNYICKYYQDKKMNFNPELLKSFQDFIDFLKLTHQQYFKFDFENTYSGKREINQALGTVLLKKVKKEELVLLHYLLNSEMIIHNVRKESFANWLKTIATEKEKITLN